MSDDQSHEGGSGLGTAVARVLYGLGNALGGEPRYSDAAISSLQLQVTTLRESLETIENKFQSYRVEMQRLAAEVEDTLEQATKRYAKSRAAESRANREDNSGGAPTGVPDLTRDPEGYRAWLARGRI